MTLTANQPKSGPQKGPSKNDTQKTGRPDGTDGQDARGYPYERQANDTGRGSTEPSPEVNRSYRDRTRDQSTRRANDGKGRPYDRTSSSRGPQTGQATPDVVKPHTK